MSIVKEWRNFWHGRKFAKMGKKCRFPGKELEVDGHVELGAYCRFRNNVILRTHGEGRIVFGDRSGCSYYCIIEATRLVQIGSHTGIAEFTVIRDTDHLVYGTDAHWRYTPKIAKPVIIGDNVLIGSSCYISPGVTIGDGAVIAAGSVVTKDIGDYEIWAGVPAKMLAHRTKNVVPGKVREYEQLVAEFGIGEDRYTGAGKGSQHEDRDAD